MSLEVLSHRLGLLGETLNFAGALVLALDLFRKRQEHELAGNLLSAKRLLGNLQTPVVDKVAVRDPGFEQIVLAKRSFRLALAGTGLLGGGFLLLVAYHILQLFALAKCP